MTPRNQTGRPTGGPKHVGKNVGKVLVLVGEKSPYTEAEAHAHGVDTPAVLGAARVRLAQKGLYAHRHALPVNKQVKEPVSLLHVSFRVEASVRLGREELVVPANNIRKIKIGAKAAKLQATRARAGSRHTHTHT